MTQPVYTKFPITLSIAFEDANLLLMSDFIYIRIFFMHRPGTKQAFCRNRAETQNVQTLSGAFGFLHIHVKIRNSTQFN